MKLQYSNPIFWIYGLFGLTAIVIFCCFPEHEIVKYGFLLLAFIVGLVTPQFYQEKCDDEMGLRFYKKTPPYTIAPVFGAMILFVTYFFLEGIISFLALLSGTIILSLNVVVLFFPSRRQPQYFIVGEEGIYDPLDGELAFKFADAKYVELTAEHLSFYEKWADHKIVFSEFKEGDKLKEELMAKIREVGIEVREL